MTESTYTDEEEAAMDAAEAHFATLPHSPDPWVAEEDEKGRWVVNCAAYTDETPLIARGSKAWPMTEDDARLIARSPALRAACLDALRTLTEAYEIESDRRQSIRMLTEALAGLEDRA